MAQTPEQIETRIAHKRKALRSNLEELEDKVKAATDWRQRVRENPGMMLAVAFGGGLLAANVVGRGSGRRPTAVAQRSSGAPPTEFEPNHPSRFRRSWENLQGALLGVAAKKFQETLDEIVPGLSGQLSESESTSRPRNARGATAGRGNPVQGEGDYQAAREYRRSAENFVHRADIERAAREAAPHNEGEAAELAAAEEAGRRRAASGEEGQLRGSRDR